jgi:hypothetical protein
MIANTPLSVLRVSVTESLPVEVHYRISTSVTVANDALPSGSEQQVPPSIVLPTNHAPSDPVYRQSTCTLSAITNPRSGVPNDLNLRTLIHKSVKMAQQPWD